MNLMPSNRFTLLIALAASLTGLFFNAPLAIAIDDVKVHTSGSTSANVLIYKIAQERGFYKEEKLNVLTIAATPTHWTWQDRSRQAGRHALNEVSAATLTKLCSTYCGVRERIVRPAS